MDAIAETQQIAVETKHKPFITSANAADIARKKWAAWREAKLAPKPPPEPIAPALQPVAPAKDPFKEQQIVLLREHIADTHTKLKASNDPKEREMHHRCLNIALDAHRVLMGEPLPGSRKPGVEKAPKQTFSEPQ